MITTPSVDLSWASSFHTPAACGNVSLDAEDFFIDDLSEFSTDDIAACVTWDANASTFSDYTSSAHPHPHSDGHTVASFCVSTNPSPACIKSDHCTPAPNTSNNSGSVLLHDSPSALDYQSPLGIEMDSSLSLPGQDDSQGFDWLTSLEDDHSSMLGAASNIGMDSFLLNNTEAAYLGGCNGLVKPSEYINEDENRVKDVTIVHNMMEDRIAGSRDCFQWDNEDGGMKLECDAAMFAPHSTGSRSARTKRVRSAGWSSSSILCNSWEYSSPTNSSNSTAHIMRSPYEQYNSAAPGDDVQAPFIVHDQGEKVDPVSSSLGASRKPEKPFLQATTKLGSTMTNDRGAASDCDDDTDMARDESASDLGRLQSRRCTHCLSQKTPQWRAGPEGPKTLCNACGVRYKSGRLFDEYRPAKSPTFLSHKHSNSHKKVMEMRRRKAFQYSTVSHQHHHRAGALHHARTARPLSTKHQDTCPHLLHNKLKTKLQPSSVEPHSPFSDISLISNTRIALAESPSRFIY